MSSASAMVVGDSRVLSQADLKDLGVQVEATEFPGPQGVRKIWITATFLPWDLAKQFRSLGYAILEKPLDADFATTDPRKAGIRDAKKWAREIRGAISEQPLIRFNVFENELPCGYIVVHLVLPHEAGIPVFGTYYLPLKDIRSNRFRSKCSGRR